VIATIQITKRKISTTLTPYLKCLAIQKKDNTGAIKNKIFPPVLTESEIK
jgi:hypothetical protein